MMNITIIIVVDIASVAKLIFLESITSGVIKSLLSLSLLITIEGFHKNNTIKNRDRNADYNNPQYTSR